MTSDTASAPQSPPPAEGGGLIEAIVRVTSVLAAIICGALILTTTFSVVVYQRGITISWLDDLLRLLLIWSVFLGSVAGVWRRDHITMDAIYTRFGPAARRLVDIFLSAVGLAVCAFVTWVSAGTTLREYQFQTLLSSGELPAWPQTFTLPLSFALMTLAYLGVLLATIKRKPAPATGPIPTL